jgi:hypothetical protein
VENNQRAWKMLAVTSNLFPQLLLTLFQDRLFFSTLMMEAMRSSETSGFTIATWHHLPEDGILRLLM